MLHSLPTQAQCAEHGRRFDALIAVALFVWNNFERKMKKKLNPEHCRPPTKVQDYRRFQLERERERESPDDAELFGSFARSPDLMRNPYRVGLVAVGYT